MAVASPKVTLPAVVEELLNEMAAAMRESARIPDEHLLSLKFVFGSSALQALDLVDRQSVTLISSPSGRHVYQETEVPKSKLISADDSWGCSSALNIFTQGSPLVEEPLIIQTIVAFIAERKEDMVLGSSGKTYTCLASCHYCSCPAFAFLVLRKSDSLLCKHLLAVYLSQVMRTCQQLSVSDKQLTDILMEEKQEA